MINKELRPNILMINDNELMLNASGIWVKRTMGWELRGYTNAVSALDWLENNEPDLIISDLGMPTMTGIDFLSKAHLKCPEAILVLLTGSEYRESLKHIKESFPLYAFVEKPWNKEMMKMLLKNAWETKQLRDRVKELELATK